MTLSTRFCIGAVESPEATAELVYQECRRMLNTPDEVQPKRGDTYINHPCGVGLAAWLMIDFHPEGPRAEVVERRDSWDDEYYQEEVDYAARRPMTNGFGCIQVSWDTSYGYRDEQGRSCSDLHAGYIAELGLWCESRNIAWKWQNEYTGEWHDRFEGLEEFGRYHDQPGGANDWFQGTVLPALRAGAFGVPE